jgi:signal transduction histidine kinase/streptogramin lyase
MLAMTHISDAIVSMFFPALQRTFFVLLLWQNAFRAVAVEGNSGAFPPGQFRARRWTTEEGLPQNRISCLKQTSDGYLWIGTWFGLARFDGLRFTVFNKNNTPLLGNDSIKSLVEGQDGTLWIGTQDGVVSYRDHRFLRLTNGINGGDGLRDRAVERMIVSSSGDLWVRSDDRVQKLHEGKFLAAIDIPRAHGAFPITERKVGGLFFLHNMSWVEIFDDGQLRTNSILDLPPCGWLCAWPAGEENFWLGTSIGLFLIERETNGNVRATQNASLGTFPVRFVYQARSGDVWVNGPANNLKRWSHAQWEDVAVEGNLSKDSVLCMEKDSEGNFWIGTDRGLIQLQAPTIRVFSAADGLPGDNVWSVCEATDGTIWFYTDKGLGRIRDNRVVKYQSTELRLHSRHIYPDQNGGVWIANNDHGIFDIQNEKFVRPVPRKGLPGLVCGVYVDSSGRFWVGASRDVDFFEGAKMISGLKLIGQEIPEVHSMLEARDKTFWFGSKGIGLVRWRDGEKTLFTESDGLGSKRIWAMHEDADGALWLGTDNGLTRYQHEKFFAFNRLHGLREDTVNCVLEDDFGYLWLSGLRGIYRIKRTDLDAVAKGRAESFSCVAFGTADGMESAETNGECQPAGWKARDGRLWFPTTHGLAVIDPRTVSTNLSSTPVVIEKIKADGELIFGDPLNVPERTAMESRRNLDPREKLKSRTEIPPGHGNVIEFHYTANSFANPNGTRFRYRLDGTDSRWREETTERTVRYINLKPGDYRFQVSAADHHGIWSAQPATFAFAIAPHVWQRWQFYVLGAAVLFGLAFLLHRYRLRWQRRVLKLDEQRALAYERTRIARDLHDDLGTALTGLALEMDVVGRQTLENSNATQQLGVTAQRTRDLAQRMREVVWAINPRCDNISSLADFLEEQIAQFLRNAGIQVHLEFPEDIPPTPIDAEARHQFALSVREALTNIVRHARASQVHVRLEFVGSAVLLSIKDNGCGFSDEKSSGNGLGNMRERIEQIGGTFACISRPGAGSEIRFRVPLS